MRHIEPQLILEISWGFGVVCIEGGVYLGGVYLGGVYRGQDVYQRWCVLSVVCIESGVY